MAQIDERRLSIAGSGVTLEGVLSLPAAPAPRGVLVVCHPHPLYGGSMDNNVVEALCDAALQEGLAALRFNFRGVGRSGGSYDNGEGEQEDVLATLQAVAEEMPGAVLGLAGYSFGAGMAARTAHRPDQPVAALILVSPPLATVNRMTFGDSPAGRLLISGDRDHVCPAAELEALAQQLRPPADCVIVEGADHSWWGHEAELRDTAGGFLRWQLA
jgi:alpha/beta superfamily hydrolase